MRKYFIKDGETKIGPFNLDQLKSEKINTNTPIWFEELDQWVSAGEVEELEDFFQAKHKNNIFIPASTTNNENFKIESTNNYSIAISQNKVGYRKSMSLSILVYGIIILLALMVLSK
jgi:GYF domain 2